MSYFKDIQTFHGAIGAPVGERPSGKLAWDRFQLRKTLIQEEYLELLEAMSEEDPAHIAKEAADLLVVVLGTAVEYGLPFDAVWQAVHESNMAKAGGPRREDGKILKPPGWKPPDIQSIIDQASESRG